jgi:hypothetical protein
MFDMCDFLHGAVHKDDITHEFYNLSGRYTTGMSKWILVSVKMNDTKSTDFKTHDSF